MDGILKLAVFLNGFVLIFGEFNDDHSFYWRRSDSMNCVPFTAFYISCNKCVCSADGVPYCTKLVCPKKFKRIIEDTPEIARKKVQLKLEEIMQELQGSSSS